MKDKLKTFFDKTAKILSEKGDDFKKKLYTPHNLQRAHRLFEDLAQSRFGVKIKQKLDELGIDEEFFREAERVAAKHSQRRMIEIVVLLQKILPPETIRQFFGKNPSFPLMESFAVLEVPYGSPLPVVKKQYRKLMRECHPDRFDEDSEQGKEATLRSQRINDAYNRIEEYYKRG